MKTSLSLLVIIVVTLLFVPSNSFTQTIAIKCNLDSIRVLARVYPYPYFDRTPLQEQANCHNWYGTTIIDTVIHYYARGVYLSNLYGLIDSIFSRGNHDSNTVADLYYFKALMQLEYFLNTPYPDTAKAIELFDSTLAYNSDYNVAWYNKGILSLLQKEFGNAKSYFEKALESDDRHLHYWLHYGVSQFLNSNEDSAKSVFETAVKVSGRRFEDFMFIADELRGWGLFSQAIDLYDSALARKKDNPDTWFNLATTIYRDDSAKDVRHLLDSALEHFDGENLSFHFVPFADDFGLYDYSVRYLDKALKKDWRNAVLWWYKSNHVFMSGDTGSAVEYLDSVIKYDSAYIFEDGNLFKAWQLTNYGLYNEALSYLDKSDISNEDTVSVHTYYYYKAICKYRLKEYTWASAICDTLLPLFPEDTSVIILCDSIQAKLDGQ